jgi:hypothetical protein
MNKELEVIPEEEINAELDAAVSAADAEQEAIAAYEEMQGMAQQYELEEQARGQAEFEQNADQ